MTGLRGFATGILLSTSILGITFLAGGYSKTEESPNNEQKVEITDNDIEAYLEENELVTITKDEYDQLTQQVEKNDEENTSVDENNNPEQNETEDKEKVIKLNLTIKSGMSTGEVANTLKEAKIIDDEQKLIDYLEDNNLVTDVKAGTYEVNSDMSIGEVAKTITSY